MKYSEFKETVDGLGQEVLLIERRAHQLSARFQTMCTLTEVLKTDILARRLTNLRKSLARQAGFESMGKDGKKLGVGIATALAGLILGGALNRNGLSALAFAMSGLDGAVQELGKSSWAVSLDQDLLVVSRDRLTPERTWVTMESLVVCLKELREKARNGEPCGNLIPMIEKLKLGHSKLDYLPSVSQWVAISRDGDASG
ncbi:MAG: hypothetical protein PHV74_15410 [Dehalococcoidia bacterium]|nr:hypothetical protein [Dehalococcoidia bacterium]